MNLYSNLKFLGVFTAAISVASASIFLEPNSAKARFGFDSLVMETSLSTTKAQSRYINAENAIVQISAIGSQYFSAGLNLNFDIRAKVSSVSATFTEPELADGYTSKNQFTVNESKISYVTMGDALLLEGGLINQNVQMNPLVASRSAYLSVREAFKFNTSIGSFVVSANQARPLISSFSESFERVETQNLTFFNENIRYILDLSKNITFEGVLGHHAFNNLNPSVAYNSLYKGNTVLGSNERDAQFAYGFNGWNYAAYLDVDLGPRWELNFSYLGIQNTMAPVDRRFGNSFGLEAVLKNGVHRYSAEVNYADVDSDAAIGTFTSYGDYKTNSITHNLWLGYGNIKDQYTIKGVFQRNRIKNPVEYVQGNGTLVQLQLSKAYEIF